MTRTDVFAKWRVRREEWGRVDAHVNGAVLCDEVLRDLVEIQNAQDDELLTLREAAAISGYTEDHLGRLIRDGTIPNTGRRGAPRIRRGDLPRRPGRRVALAVPGAYDPDTDARKLVARRKGGAYAS